MRNKLFIIGFLLLGAHFSQAQISADLSGRLQNTLDSICTKYKVKGASAALLLPDVGTWTGISGISRPWSTFNATNGFGNG